MAFKNNRILTSLKNLMNTLHDEIISVLKQKTPPGENAVDLLTDIIPMSKEAAYRRLRGEIQLTLAEAARICQRLNISLDHLIEIKNKNSVSFRISPMFSSDFTDRYNTMMQKAVHAIEQVQNDPNGLLYVANNTLPTFFLFNYKHLSKIILFKWRYQVQLDNTPKRMNEIIIPESTLNIQSSYCKKIKKIPTTLILDKNCFETFVNDLLFFSKINLITLDDLRLLKKEALELLDEIELAATNGVSQSGEKINLYISHTFLDASYIYAQNTETKYCIMHMYGINHLVCYDERICNEQKMWIESLIRYSTLITKSGELQRTEYLKKQRSLINLLAPE